MPYVFGLTLSGVGEQWGYSAPASCSYYSSALCLWHTSIFHAESGVGDHKSLFRLVFWGLAKWDVATGTWVSSPLPPPSTPPRRGARVRQLDIVIEQWESLA